MGALLRARQLPIVLNQVNGDGVKAAILIQSDGALLGSAGEDLPEINDKIIGAITANIWKEFEQSGHRAIKAGDLEVMLLELEGGRLGIGSCGDGFLVCIYAEGSVKFGLIKAKLEKLKKHLNDHLRNLSVRPD